MMDLTETVRHINLALTVALIFACCMRLTRDWPQWSHRDRVVRVHLIAYLGCIAYAAAEQIALQATPGYRSFLYLAVHVSFGLALWRTRKEPVR